jgi:hypothetical protein
VAAGAAARRDTPTAAVPRMSKESEDRMSKETDHQRLVRIASERRSAGTKRAHEVAKAVRDGTPKPPSTRRTGKK